MSVGVDIEDISRFKDKSQKFLNRIYTKSEQKYCLGKSLPQNHLAVRFCAKEAVIKALNVLDIKHPELNKIEIYHDKNKCPKVKLPDIKEYNNLKIEVSLSHDRTKAVAFVTISER